MRPILFNTGMVRAIIDGRKTVTRRVVNPRYRDGEVGFQVVTNKHTGQYVRIEFVDEWENETRWMNEPYRPGDILYVRETWCRSMAGTWLYKATDTPVLFHGWRPSIHMPKEAARLFLRVKNVRVERLREITEEEALAEGIPDEWPMAPVYCPYCKGDGLVGTYDRNSLGYIDVDCPYCEKAIIRFSNLWDSTIKKSDLPRYGWNANPWCWVISFERVSKEEALKEEQK